MTWISEDECVPHLTSTVHPSSPILQKYRTPLPVAIAPFLFSLCYFLKTIGEEKKVKLKD